MNSVQPSAEAVAIKNDRIMKVGTNTEISSLIGKATEVINLQGKTVVPGLTDSHIHVGDFSKFLTWLNLNDADSIKAVQQEIKERVQKIPKGRWIIGSGWNHANFAEQRYLNFQDLDEVSQDNPVILYHQCGRVCVVNSKALESAGVTKATVSPSGGTIEKDPETGETTGILQENATDLVWTIIPEPSEEEIIESAGLACQKIVEAGLTSIHWIFTSATELTVIQKLQEENRLPIRVYLIAPANILDKLDASTIDSDNEMEKPLGIKVFVDGSLAARTAALNEPYVDDQTTTGQLLYSREELNTLVTRAHKGNLRLVIHAMGDKAISMALDAIEKALREVPRKDHRYRIEHASVLNYDLIRRIKELGVIVSVQPKCVISEFAVWSAVERLGSKRARLLYPLKTLINAGIRIIGGSDCPMEPLSPLQGIQAAVTRQYYPEEQITVDEALEMYTTNPAYSSFEDSTKGSIAEGKLADLTVLSDDPRSVPSNEIGDITVDLTLVGGKIVYQK
ncbi:MAG: amidohydrolase [Candidatus Bathyarchaeota archaeon]|nr:amidohydrolase [Candidatus Bathyarchaeum sp.]